MRNESLNSLVKAALEEGYLDRAVQTPDGNLAWSWSDIKTVLEVATANGVAVLGGDMCAIREGQTLEIFPGATSFRLWSTAPQETNEPWNVYCRRTFEESVLDLTFFEEHGDRSGAKIRPGLHVVPSFAVRDDVQLMIPRDKHDHVRAELAIAAGYPAVEPILPELLEWIQDMNWPVAQTLLPFLQGIGLPLMPHLRSILSTDDEVWKYWVMSKILRDSYDLTWQLQDELKQIAASPTASEIDEELDRVAREVLNEHGISSSSP